MDEDKMSTLCTVIVCSCDAYSDLWEAFFKLFKTYWENCPYQIILNTESKVFSYEGLDIKCLPAYENGRGVPYGKRMKDCLSSVKTPYVLLMLDDFFLRKNVEKEKINQIIMWLDENPEINCFNFDCIKDEYDIDDGRFEGYKRRSKYGEYRYNMQAGVWRTEALKAAWKDSESPWQWENYGNMRSWDKDGLIYCIKDDNFLPINYGKKPGLTWGVVRGKWIQNDVEPLFQTHEIQIDFFKRGIYENVSEVNKKNIYQFWVSVGLCRVINYAIWSLKTHICRFMKKETVSYSKYLNRKYYDRRKRDV